MINDEATDEEGYVSDTELSDSSFRDTPEKESLNTSMGNISVDTTEVPIRSDLNSISKKSRQRVIQKPIKAIDTVLEDIAPGQSSSLKEKCFQLQKKKKKRNPIAWLLDPSTE